MIACYLKKWNILENEICVFVLYKATVSKSATSASSRDPWQVDLDDLSDIDSDAANKKPSGGKAGDKKPSAGNSERLALLTTFRLLFVFMASIMY